MRSRVFVAGAVVAVALGISEPAWARCPEERDVTLCWYKSSVFQPSLVAASFSPREANGTLLGGGLEIILFAWMSNSDAPGPSHGKIRLSIIGLRTLERDPEVDAIYEAGVLLSFEKNPSRRWLIPFAGPGVGVFASQTTDMYAWLLSGTVGVYIIHLPVFSVALEGSYSVATSRTGDLSGPRTELHIALPRW